MRGETLSAAMAETFALNHLDDVIADLKRRYYYRLHSECPRSWLACGLDG